MPNLNEVLNAYLQYIGARYVPKFFKNPDDLSNDWKSGVMYEALTIVTYNNDSYTSKIPVPDTVGDPASNPQYWACTTKYTAALVALQTTVGNHENRLDHLELLDVFVTPQMFGAVGDGVHDDAQAFIDAINSGFPIFVPHGTYLIGESLVFPDTKFITIIGEDKADTVLKFEGVAGEYLFNIAGQFAGEYRKYGRIENMQLVGNDANNGIKLEYNSDKLSLKNLYIHNFVYGIKEVNGWSHSYYDIVITHCQYGYHGSGVINAIVFNNLLCNLCDTNFYLHGGRNILINGGDFGGATDYNMDVYGIAGLCINAPYIESIGTHGITFASCFNMTINGFEISAFKEGDTIFNFISTSGTINGLTIDGQGWDGTTIIPNTVGINIEDCNHGISFNGVFLRNLAKGIYIKNTRGEINYPRFEYVTTPIEFYNHEYIYMNFVMLFSDFVNCIFNASAINTKAIFTDWKPYYNISGGGVELPKPSNSVVIPYNCMIMVNNGVDFKPAFRKYNAWVYADGTIAQSDT